jgi:hypothetical protein
MNGTSPEHVCTQSLRVTNLKTTTYRHTFEKEAICHNVRMYGTSHEHVYIMPPTVTYSNHFAQYASPNVTIDSKKRSYSAEGNYSSLSFTTNRLIKYQLRKVKCLGRLLLPALLLAKAKEYFQGKSQSKGNPQAGDPRGSALTQAKIAAHATALDRIG